MATGTATVSIPITGLPSGTKTVSPPSVTLAAAIGQITDVSIATNTSISVPTGATFVTIAIPVTTSTITLKGVAGDTGIALCVSPGVPLWTSFCVASTQTTFVLNSTVATSVEISFT